jgi:hypothetical protein
MLEGRDDAQRAEASMISDRLRSWRTRSDA